MTKNNQSNQKKNREPKEERELINEFGRHESDQPIPQPKDYDEIEY